MALTSLPFLGFLLLFLHQSDAQTVIGYSSSFSSMDLPRSSSPTKQTIRFWPSLPPRGRSDVPIRVTIQDRLTTMNTVDQGHRITSETTHFSPSLTMTSSAENPIRETAVTEATSSRPRTDIARLAFKQAFRRGAVATKNPNEPLNVRSSSTVGETADDGLGTDGNSDKGSVGESEDGDIQGLGSGTVASKKDDLHPPLPTRANEMAQYQLQEHTMMSKATNVKAPTPESHMSVLSTARTSTTVSTEHHLNKRIPQALNTTQQIPQTVGLLGKLASNNPAEGVGPNQGAAVLTSPQPTSPRTNQHPQTAGQLLTAKNSSILKTQSVNVSATQEPVGTSSQNSKAVQLGRPAAGTIVRSSRTGNVSLLTPSDVPAPRSRFSPTYQASVVQRNHSVPLGHPYQAPYSTYNPVPSPSARPYPNGTLLYWGDLSRTLAFAWELHVYGSGSLFLILFAGATLGLTLSPATNCPHRGALAIANALLFLAGGLRAALFFIDPYGTRKVLPHSAVAALYNLPLHLLVWTQASLVLLALRTTGISVFPATVEHPPLVGVLAVLHCTLMLGVDLLSAALSPVVPVTLQVLSLCWGLAICLGFLCFVFPRIRCPPILSHGVPREVRRKTWSGNQKIGIILGKVLVVCAVLGALCCGLHVHATLWLYGFLGDWTSFNWGWWLVHFWARLLELGWAFALLLLSSWVFWRPAGPRRGDEGGQEGRPAGDVASPGQSAGSPQRHTCWSKIVQSLRGKPCRKSDSNGVGGGTGEIPNNWTGQERAGADISKNLIRNQNQEQSIIQPGCVKDSNCDHNHRDHAPTQGMLGGSASSGMVLQQFGGHLQRSVSGSLDHDRDTSLSFCEFDLRPPSPIDLTRSIDEALHREHLLEGGSLFHPLNSQSPSPRSAVSQGPWLRRNSDPQLLSESSDAPTESSMPLGGSILSSVPSRQVTAPPTPSHPDNRWVESRVLSVPSSVSCPVSLRPTRTSTGHLGEEDTRPFITPDSEKVRGKSGRSVGSRSYLEVSRHDDSVSASSEIIDL